MDKNTDYNINKIIDQSVKHNIFENLIWTYSEYDNTLTISGKGAIKDFRREFGSLFWYF